MQPARARSSRAAQGGSGFVPVTHMVSRRDVWVCQPMPLLSPEGAFYGEVMVHILVVLGAVKEQAEPIYAAA